MEERAIPCDVVELRRYTLRPGARETLVELFEREFIETQEAVGIHLLGQFKDLDDPDVFVWLRGFRDMSVRAAALEAVYGGPVWNSTATRTTRRCLTATMSGSCGPRSRLSELIFDRSRRLTSAGPS
jgi:NIPSNAP